MIGVANSLIPNELSELDSDFINYFGELAGLWLPCDKHGARTPDFSGNLDYGTLNGGVITNNDGIGVLGNSWKMVAASKQYIEIPKAIVLSPPATFVAVFNTGNAAVGQDLIAICTPSSDTDYMRLCISGSGTGQLEAIHRSSGSQGIAMSVAGVVSNTWHMAAAVFSSNSSRSIYLDSAAVVTDSTSVPGMATLARTDLGRLGRTSDTSYFQGTLALGIVFPVALSAAQVSALYSSLLYGEPFKLFQPSIFERLYSSSQPNIPLNLTSKSFVFSSAYGQQVINRPLRSDLNSQSISKSSISIQQNKYSQSESNNSLAGNINVSRPLYSNITTGSELAGNISKNILLNSEIMVQSIGQATTKQYTNFQLLSFRRYSSQYFVQCGYSEDNGQ